MSQGMDAPKPGFRPPRVPFDLRCVFLATCGFLLVSLADMLLSSWWGCASPVAQLMGLLAAQLGRLAFLGEGFRLATAPLWGIEAYDLAWWQALTAGLLFFAIWAVFGGALLRTAALRLTRDEPLSLGEAVRFGLGAGREFLLVPVLVGLFAGFFVLMNLLAGLLMSLWFVGSSLLSLLLFPLTLISSLLILLAIAGGLVGLPLMWAGVATERNGALEAVSRAFSYMSARPFRFLFGYLLLFVFMGAILLVGDAFEQTAKATIQAGIVRGDLDDMVQRSPPADVLGNPAARNHERVLREARGIAALQNIRHARWYDALGFLWMWLFLNLFLLGFKGYALYALLGGTLSVYVELRLDVDGTAEDQIGGLPEAEAAGGEPSPRWVGAPESGDAAAGAEASDAPKTP